jgi:hypothetical protein
MQNISDVPKSEAFAYFTKNIFATWSVDTLEFLSLIFSAKN